MKQSLQTYRLLTSTKMLLLAAIVGFPALASALFFTSQQAPPHVSELAFIEYSSDPSVIGSVIPASCESTPPVNHFVGDCAVPPTPASITATCNAAGDNATISWPAAARASHYAIRLDYPGDPAPHLVQNDTYGGLSYTFPVTPGVMYNAWTHACNISGCSAPVSTTFACPPSITFTSSPGLIGLGSSSNLSWSVIGATSCTASGSSEWTGAKSPSGGSENVSPTVTTSYNLSCTGYDGTTVRTVTVTLPSGNIGAGPPCDIPAGSTSCYVMVYWNSANFLGSPSLLQGTTIFSSGVSGSLPRAVNPENNRFTLRDTGSLFEVSTSAGVSCASGSVWVTGTQTCTLLPVITLHLVDTIVRSGNSARFAVNVTANYDLQCTVVGGLSDSFIHLASPTTRSYAKVTDPLTSAQIVRVECTSIPHPVLTGSTERRINVVPVFQEI